jgi:ferredoxin-NADP reductase
MNIYKVKIISIGLITRDVLQIFTEKPTGLDFKPGQATEISVNKKGWEDQTRPFTFTSLPDDNFLQFTIKTYPSHEGVTKELLKLRRGDGLILHDVFGAIEYKKEGLFIAGGAGVTPFISILRSLKSKDSLGSNKLISANRTKDDIILKYEFGNMLGNNFINILSHERDENYFYGFITEQFLSKQMTVPSGNFYLCGPPPMMDAVGKILESLNVDKKLIIREDV